jgi:uncharacterized protein (TIGR02996 family)
MNDLELSQHPLFESIREDPENDEARLVLADALMQDSDPRGELIVMQCELARLLGAAPFPRTGWVRLRLEPLIPKRTEGQALKITRKQNELLKKNPQWSELQTNEIQIAFWRGFINELQFFNLGSVSTGDFRELLDRAPLVSRIYFLSWREEDFARIGELLGVLLEHPIAAQIQLLFFGAANHYFADIAGRLRFPRLEQLVLAGWTEPLPPEAMQTLARNPHLPRLHSFETQGGGMMDVGAIVSLLQTTQFTLEQLRIPNAMLDVAEAAAVAAEEKLARLKILDLSSCSIGPKGLATLLASPKMPALERLAIAHLKLKAVSMEALASCEKLSDLTMLDVESNAIGPQGIKALAGSKNLGAVRSLMLRNCWLKDEGIEHLVASPLMSQLEELNVRSNKLTDHSAKRLASSPNAGRLLKLNINNNKGISRDGARLLWESENLAGCRIYTDHSKSKR